mgnify:FL=1
MKNNKANPAKAVQSKIAGLTTLEAVFYIISFPILIILAGVFGYEMWQLVPYYSFWPFVGTILAGVFGLVFLIVALCVTRKKSKKPIRHQTVVLIVTVVILTAVIGVALDVVLPDILAKLTSSTLFVEDLGHEYEDQAQFNAQIVRKFIMLNLLNGNYDPKYDYSSMSSNSEVSKNTSYYSSVLAGRDKAYYDTYIWNKMPALKQELFNFIYDEWILTDVNYAFLGPDTEWGNRSRRSFAHAVTDYIYPEFEKLSKEGFNNDRIAYLFNNNYSSMHQDGYVTYDDSLILYATSNRMTIPVVIRLLLDEGYTYSDGKGAEMNNGTIVEPDDAYFFELYMPDEVKTLLATSGAVEWDSAHQKALVVNPVEGVKVNKGAVIIPSYDENHNLIGGYVRQPVQWSVLDMDGKNMDVASLDGITIDLSFVVGLLPDSIKQALSGVVEKLQKPLTLSELLDVVNLLIKVVAPGGSVNDFLGELLDGIKDTISTATGGRELSLGICIDDTGALKIAVRPSNVEKGLLGYQYMTWMQSNSLLFAVISVMSLRNWLFIFGAVSVLAVFAAGCCREYKKRIKDEFEANYVPVTGPVDGAEAPVVNEPAADNAVFEEDVKEETMSDEEKADGDESVTVE